MPVLSNSNKYVINFGKFLWLNKFSQICVKPKTSNGFPWWLINMKRYVCLCVKMWWRLKAIFTAWFSMLTVLFYVFMFYVLCFVIFTVCFSMTTMLLSLITLDWVCKHISCLEIIFLCFVCVVLVEGKHINTYVAIPLYCHFILCFTFYISHYISCCATTAIFIP